MGDGPASGDMAHGACWPHPSHPNDRRDGAPPRRPYGMAGCCNAGTMVHAARRQDMTGRRLHAVPYPRGARLSGRMG
ncbi:hypothetical protein NJLHNGOC_04260 [Novacetimonas cocois]|uniref:Uncharacterized protein n=1 Tax=Novacetimonas cocois TaxID=1747507 RepID=A0A365YZJ7_9PROT|nr:hypothetical protein NJLHNGOC_04260 [Novacetimonas cocois]